MDVQNLHVDGKEVQVPMVLLRVYAKNHAEANEQYASYGVFTQSDLESGGYVVPSIAFLISQTKSHSLLMDGSYEDLRPVTIQDTELSDKPYEFYMYPDGKLVEAPWLGKQFQAKAFKQIQENVTKENMTKLKDKAWNAIQSFSEPSKADSTP